MKVSLNTVKQLAGVELPPIDELVDRVNRQLGGVEQVIDLATKYRDAQIVRVVTCSKHPDADKLSVCEIDAGVGDLITVVCGANNVKAGMWAVWLPPESTVPSTFDTPEPFVLGARELRGVMSNGMLASAKELDLGDDHDGIVELNDNDLPQGKSLAAGVSFSETFDLDDIVIDIENKMFTHRPDLFGQLGVAREIFAILHPEPESSNSTGVRFAEPDWFWVIPEFESADSGESSELRVFNDTPDKARRFMAVVMKDIKVGPSPLWLQATLVRWGSKPINNVVDITNYIMLLTAQPVHAYDYAKLRGQALGVRMARSGETVKLLNDKTYQLSEDDIIIADGDGPVGLAGLMGGGESEVSLSTTDIVLEVANFDMYTVRKSSMRHGLFTDALTRFNKGQSVLQADRVMNHLMSVMQTITGARQASSVHDTPDYSGDKTSVNGEMRITASFVNHRLGLDLTAAKIGNLLRLVNFASHAADESSDELVVTAPFWRTDIEQREDIVEEVGRLYGFDKLPRELPARSIKPAPINQMQLTKRPIRESLRRSGANEVLTYSFVHENIIKKSEQDITQAFQLSNALSPDLQYYRLSLLPSLLDKVHQNIKSGHDEFVIYEIGKSHNKKYHADDDDGLPGEIEMLDAVYASKESIEGAAYYRMRRLLDQLAADCAVEFTYKPADQSMDYPLTAPYDLARSAMVETTDGQFVGMVGELKQSVIRAFKLPSYVAGMSLDVKGLSVILSGETNRYRPLSRFPSLSQDISLKLSREVAYGQLLDTVRLITSRLEAESSHRLELNIEPIAIYQPADITDIQTITFRIHAVHHDRTLTDDDIKPLIRDIANQANADYNATVV